MDTGDFRLIDRKVCDAMATIEERNRFLRGLVSWVGFKQIAVEYVRDERAAGETKYPFKKMMKLALDGIAAFSYKPLKMATGVGFFFSVASFLYLIVVLIQALFFDVDTNGWASTIAVLLLSQGIVMMMLGIIGEYIGRIFDEVRGRPIYIVAEVVNSGQDDEKKQRNVDKA